MVQRNIKSSLALLNEGTIDTDYGEFRMSIFRDGKDMAIVLSKGKLEGKENVFCRIHSECISSQVFFGRECGCKEQMIKSLKTIQAEGIGLIIYLHQKDRANGAIIHVTTLDLKRGGKSQREAYKMNDSPENDRQYDIAAKVIKHLKIKSIVLFTSSLKKIYSMKALGIKVVGKKKPNGEITIPEKSSANVAKSIKLGTYKSIIDKVGNKKRIFVVGDLNVDYLISQKSLGDGILDRPKPIVGGTGFNAAKAFRERGFESIIFGKIGNDREGMFIKSELEKNKINSFIGVTESKYTGNCHIVFIDDINLRFIIKEDNNANDYDCDNLEQALHLSNIKEGDLAFVAAHPFVLYGKEYSRKLLEIIAKTGAKIILDIVPHNLYEKINITDFKTIIGNNVIVIIGEYLTLMKIIECEAIKERPNENHWEKLTENFNSLFLIVRYGIGNISNQTVLKRRAKGGYQILEEIYTGYPKLTAEERRGFGDRLTADFLYKYFYYNDIFYSRNVGKINQ